MEIPFYFGLIEQGVNDVEFKKDLFTCYSLSLFHFLKANGFYYIFKERNPETNLYYWVFDKTPELKKAVKVYMENLNK